jgi:periplasmic protein TonB
MAATPPHAPATPTDTRRAARFGLTRRAWLVIAVAVAAGVLLFLMLWADQRRDSDFYRVGSPPATKGREFADLPAPTAAGADAGGASGLRGGEGSDAAGTGPGAAARIDPAPPPEATRRAAPPPPTAPISAPVPTRSPAPRYPTAELRRGQSGEVLLRVHVGADGVPYAVDVVDGSGSRGLDRAAVEALRKWRFRPAMRGGQPVPGELLVPISFDARG